MNQTYQLTNKILELLQDPKNREIVNGGQEGFKIGVERFCLPSDAPQAGEAVMLLFKGQRPALFEQLPKFLQFRVLTWYIKLLPEFQVENPINKKILADLNEEKSLIDYYKNRGEMSLYYARINNLENQLYNYQTLSEALLKSGAMTVEELEKEYLKLSK